MVKKQELLEKLYNNLYEIEEEIEKVEAEIRTDKAREDKINFLLSKIAEKEDSIADQADKRFRTWKWRHNPKWLKHVANQMAEATLKERNQLTKLQHKEH